MKLKEATLTDGRKIKVFQPEMDVLKKAGKLEGSKVKEDKTPTETKEDKTATVTKKEAMEKMSPSKKRPVNIGKGSIKK